MAASKLRPGPPEALPGLAAAVVDVVVAPLAEEALDAELDDEDVEDVEAVEEDDDDLAEDEPDELQPTVKVRIPTIPATSNRRCDSTG